MLHLKAPSLLRQQSYVDGRWCDADDLAAIMTCEQGKALLRRVPPNLAWQAISIRATSAAYEMLPRDWRAA